MSIQPDSGTVDPRKTDWGFLNTSYQSPEHENLVSVEASLPLPCASCSRSGIARAVDDIVAHLDFLSGSPDDPLSVWKARLAKFAINFVITRVIGL